jgi:hypothetical protein
MDQALLVGPDIEIGRDAVAALDAAGLKPVVAMMAVFPEYGDWRLVFSSPALDQARSLKAHEQVAGVLRGDFIPRLPGVMLFPTKDPFIRELRKRYGKEKNITGLRLGGQMFGNRFVDAAYVYRIQ